MREKEKIDYILRLGLIKRMVHTDFLWLTSLEIFKSCRFKILKYSEVVFANFTSDIPKIGWENLREREREREPMTSYYMYSNIWFSQSNWVHIFGKEWKWKKSMSAIMKYFKGYSDEVLFTASVIQITLCEL